MATVGSKRSLSQENLPPQVIARLTKEIAAFASNPPAGIRYVPPEDDKISEIHATIQGPEETPYASGTFHIKLVLGHDYPQAPPRGFFLTKIYHPNVSAKGEICVNTLKRDWSADVSLSHVLQVIRCLLIVPFPESSLNDEAGKLFMESYEEYCRRAKLLTRLHATAHPSNTGGGAETFDLAASSSQSPPSKAHRDARAAEEDGVLLPSKHLKLSPSPLKSKAERERDRQKKSKQKGLKRL
uniref:E2 ubiquitin-conjugating enzyme n=1 Tax=Rhizochromulina marina TaxID=1034831 RepID=A0A7S2W6M0_9STRA|mmetsp:Transcript_15295/g.45311  ORF Transcript_15295/g.45311 Transcript_15295/m.45311 type:complete len:241 (+) Transcript_15295:174-896(+)